MPLNLERDPQNRVLVDGVICQHWASQPLHNKAVTWADGIKRDEWQQVPGKGNEDAFFARTMAPGIDKRMCDVFVIKDDEEIHLYKIL